MGHFAISDIDADKHYSFERFSRGAAGLAGSQSESVSGLVGKLGSSS